MNHLEVKTRKLSFVLGVLLGIILVPLILFSLINGVIYGLKIMQLGIGLMLLITFAGIFWLVRRGHSKSVKYFSDEGLTRNDGRSFAWTDLSGVVYQNRIVSIAHKVKINSYVPTK
jgi:hypothetical protein